MKLISFSNVCKVFGEFSLLGKEAIKKSIGCIHLEFVITSMLAGRFDKDFENIVVPGFAIVFDNISK